MKKYLILVLMFVVYVNVFGQSRQNRVNAEYGRESESIEDATGWCYNDKTGQWVENENVIDDSECRDYWVSHVYQNFLNIKIKEVKYGEKKYFAIVIEKRTGDYKYPNIKRDWKEYEETAYFLLDSSQYDSLKTKVQMVDSKSITLSSNIYGSMTSRFHILGDEHEYSDENILAKITKSIISPSVRNQCFIANSQKDNDKKVVRFLLPTSCRITKRNMKKSYFEVPYKEFKNIFIWDD